MSKKEEILLLAKKLFNENGYVDVGVRELARLLHISPGNLSYHFSKKEDILIALLEDLSVKNTALYMEFSNNEKNTAAFLTLLKNIFENQFDFRGVFIGNQIVQNELMKQDHFLYQRNEEKRKENFRIIFSDLTKNGFLRCQDADIEFLISFTTLFGRFWISEATLFNRSPEKEKTIAHYMYLFAKQIELFSTPKGKQSVKSFLTSMA